MDYLTKKQAAERLQVSQRQVERYMGSGRLKFIRLGHRTVRIPASSVEKLLRGKSEGVAGEETPAGREAEPPQPMSASESPSSVLEREAGNRNEPVEGATKAPEKHTGESLDVKLSRALSSTGLATNAYGQSYETIFGAEDWHEMSEEERRQAIEEDYREVEREQEQEREKADRNAAADADIDRRVSYMDAKQRQVEELLRGHGLKYTVRGQSTYSRYLNVDLPGDESAQIRVSDHAPPAGRGGMKEGGLDYHDESDVSLHPGDDALGKVRHFLAEKGALPSERRGWFRILGPGQYEIGKTKIGDLSTFVHEPAHAYLEMWRELSGREGASDPLKDDFKKITEWLGTSPEEAWKNGFTREQHEQWARANEQYVREGKAPTAGLRRAFHNFAVWLSSIYRRTNALGVELSPEIRGVMDRLYAGEEAVNRGAADAAKPLFTSPEEAGWTEAEYRNYADAHGMALEQAREQVTAELKEAAAKRLSQDVFDFGGEVNVAAQA